MLIIDIPLWIYCIVKASNAISEANQIHDKQAEEDWFMVSNYLKIIEENFQVFDDLLEITNSCERNISNIKNQIITIESSDDKTTIPQLYESLSYFEKALKIFYSLQKRVQKMNEEYCIDQLYIDFITIRDDENTYTFSQIVDKLQPTFKILEQRSNIIKGYFKDLPPIPYSLITNNEVCKVRKYCDDSSIAAIDSPKTSDTITVDTLSSLPGEKKW